MELEWLGEQLFTFFQDTRGMLDRRGDVPRIVHDRLATANSVVEQSLQHFTTMFERTRTDNAGLMKAYFTELVIALRSNLRKGGILESTEDDIAAIASRPDRFLSGVPASACHRDVATDNIYFRRSEDARWLTVKFADPRRYLPFLESAEMAAVDHTPPAWGSVAADYAALWISLSREEQEIRHQRSSIHLDAHKSVRAAVENAVTRGLFSQSFFTLNLAVFTSLYVGCKCEYCLDPVRKWLYDQMVVECRRLLGLCRQHAQGHRVF
jgi:hypothetical protein